MSGPWHLTTSTCRMSIGASVQFRPLTRCIPSLSLDTHRQMKIEAEEAGNTHPTLKSWSSCSSSTKEVTMRTMENLLSHKAKKLVLQLGWQIQSKTIERRTLSWRCLTILRIVMYIKKSKASQISGLMFLFLFRNNLVKMKKRKIQSVKDISVRSQIYKFSG